MKSKWSLLVLTVAMTSPVFADDDIWGVQGRAGVQDHAAASSKKTDDADDVTSTVEDVDPPADQGPSVSEEDDVD